MLTLIEKYKNEVLAEENLRQLEAQGKITSFENAADILWYKNEIFAIYQLCENQDIKMAKQYFYNCGLLDEFRIAKYNDRLLDYGINHICYVLLSDSKSLVERYSGLRYIKGKNAEYGMDESVLSGFQPVWCNTIQMFMAKDKQGIERNLNIIELKTIPLKKEPLLEIDFEFYKALYNGNKNKCEEVLEKLVSPAMHKRRNNNKMISGCISIPALGYAKLAWMYDLNISIKNKLIPEELLPLLPNDKYEIPYGFLRDG